MIINVMAYDKENIFDSVKDYYIDANNNLHIISDGEVLVISQGIWKSVIAYDELEKK